MEDLISRDALLEEFKEPGFLMSFIIRHTIEKAPAADERELIPEHHVRVLVVKVEPKGIFGQNLGEQVFKKAQIR